jgi:hypothetical protein
MLTPNDKKNLEKMFRQVNFINGVVTAFLFTMFILAGFMLVDLVLQGAGII